MRKVIFTTNLINNNLFSVQDSGSFPLPLQEKMVPKNTNPYHQCTRTNLTVKRKLSVLLIWDEFIFSVIARGKATGCRALHLTPWDWDTPPHFGPASCKQTRAGRRRNSRMAAGHPPPEASLQPVPLGKGQSSSHKQGQHQEEEHQEPIAQRRVFV